MLSNMPEQILQSLDIELILARSLHLDSWDYRLMSPFWRIYVHGEEGAYLEENEIRIPIEPNTIVVIPAWFTFGTGLNNPIVQHVIHFELRGLPAARQRRLLNDVMMLPLSGTNRTLFSDWTSSTPSSSLAATAKATAFMYSVISNVIEARPNIRGLQSVQRISSALELALDRIEVAPYEGFKNADLAHLCGMNVDHFIRTFRQSTGVSPGKYRLEIRLTQAARDLANGTQTIEHIAESTGFSDRFHFSKAFKKCFGVSPGRYRSSHEIT